MKNASNSFKKINESLKVLAKSLPGHIYWKDTKGAFLGCNETQAQSAGFTIEEMIGKTDFDMPWHDQAGSIRENDLEIIKTGIPKLIEEESVLSNGELSIFLSNKVPLHSDSGEIIGILGMSLDITRQKIREKELEKEIKETKITLSSIVENIPAHIFWKDKQCKLIGCNNLQAKNLGFSSVAEMIGKNNYELINKSLSPEEILRQGNAITIADQQVMNEELTITVEEPLVLASGETAIYLSKKTPLYNASGEVVGLLGISFDITKEREAQLKETKHKLDAMTAISSSIAHELRTPLASLELGTTNLQDFLPSLISTYKIAKDANLPVEEIDAVQFQLLSTLLSDMRFEIRSSFNFIDMLLVKLKPTVSAKSSNIFYIEDCINEVLKRYPFQGQERNLIDIKIDHNFKVKGDILLLTHVFFNLLKNALYYIASAGKGRITIKNGQNEEFNEICFKDTGQGISDSIVSKIFDQFYSQTYHGAGVGLTFCRMVMDSIDGKISCQSAEGEYTEFTLYFPKI